MVCPCLAGGRLIVDKLAEATRLHEAGDLQGSIDLCRNILKEEPHQHEALQKLGIIALQRGNADLALKFLELAIGAKPDFTSAWYNHALTLHAQKCDDEAMQSAKAALELDPTLAEAWNLKALIAKDKKDNVSARAFQEKAIKLQPNNPSFYDNLAAILLAMKEFQGAYLCSLQALACDPAYISLSYCVTTNAMGYPDLALNYYPRMHAHLPPSQAADSKVGEAMSCLQIGEFETGWNLWEQRTVFDTNLGALPFWQNRGQTADKLQRLFLYEDQGIGDAIQLLRYVPLMKNYAEHLTLCVRSPLQKLCEENFPYCDIMLESDAALTYMSDVARCRFMSLPALLDRQLQNLPNAPYIVANKERCAVWRERMRHLPTPRIGLVWAGGMKYKNDSMRSMTFSMLRPVTEGYTNHFVSLQESRAEDKDAEIFDAAPFLHNFSDTAAAIAELDLVITVDTAVAHLAGALGKAVWILLPFSSDWRWFLGREDSPWYKTARLFRQHSPDDWTDVINRVRNDCHLFIKGDNSVLQAPVWQGDYLRQNPYALPLPV